MTTPGFTRLHITPLDDKLIGVVLSASLRSLARNISYHALETFPERRYGYLELPEEDADKLRRKLNGATLRGTKMSIEKAREAKAWREEPEEGSPAKKHKKEKKEAKVHGDATPKKRKRDPEVLDGLTIKDRKIKRGWTETPAETREKKRNKESNKSQERSKNKAETEEKEEDTEMNEERKKKKKKEKKEKQRAKSKHTDEPECLLKIKLPSNAVSNLSTEEADKLRKRRKKGSEREYTVHEFDKTTLFPSFLKDNTAVTRDSQQDVEYVKGKGWVDREGAIIETVKETSRPEKTKLVKKRKKPVAPPVVEEESSGTSDSETSSSGSDSSDEEEESEAAAQPEDKPDTEEKVKEATGKDGEQDSADTTSDSASDSSDSSPDSSDEAATPKAQVPATLPLSTPLSAKPLSIAIPPDTPSSKQVHPLEALYKRPPPLQNGTSTPGPKAEAFSFFGGAEGSDMEEDGEPAGSQATLAPPMTPFTKQDFEFRTTRSAAPTPDTAHPSRMQSFFSDVPPLAEAMDEDDGKDVKDDEDDEDEDEEEEGKEGRVRGSIGGGVGGGTGAGEEESEFVSFFWKNRRDLKSSYLKRKKTAQKERRHRDNKMRASRAV